MDTFATVLLHGAAGSWDEILLIALAAAVVAVFAFLLLKGRAFEPEYVEEREEEAT